MITREKFLERTGREPVQDDLARCNCPEAGEVGHWYCGWDGEADLPEFETAGRARRQRLADLQVAEPRACDCECHTSGVPVMHFVPCC